MTMWSMFVGHASDMPDRLTGRLVANRTCLSDLHYVPTRVIPPSGVVHMVIWGGNGCTARMRKDGRPYA